MSGNNMLFDRNEDEDYNFYDSEDILNDDTYENDFDFYETDFDGNDFKTTPEPRREEIGSKSLVPPPLPLYHFDKEDSSVARARTITGRRIPHINHFPSPPGSASDGLHNPMICR